MIFVYYGRIDLKDGAFVMINEVDGKDRERKHIPVGSVACIMLEPGPRISHAAVKKVGCGRHCQQVPQRSYILFVRCDRSGYLGGWVCTSRRMCSPQAWG
jgi:hypothetical protein